MGIRGRPNAEKMREKLQQEYDLLISRINDYYGMRKKLLACRRDKLIADVESSEVAAQYQEFKQHLADQQLHWQRFLTQLA